MMQSGFFFFTNRPNAEFESSKFHSFPPAVLSEKQNYPPLSSPNTREDEYFYEVDHLCTGVEQFFD